MVLVAKTLPNERQKPACHTMASNDLATQVARASAAMVLSYFGWNVPTSAPEGIKYISLLSSAASIRVVPVDCLTSSWLWLIILGAMQIKTWGLLPVLLLRYNYRVTHISRASLSMLIMKRLLFMLNDIFSLILTTIQTLTHWLLGYVVILKV